MALRQTIARILDIPDSDQWVIEDAIPESHLYLIHYIPTADLNDNKISSLHGVVVDVDRRTVVAKSYGYIPRTKPSTSPIKIDRVDDHIHLSDLNIFDLTYHLNPLTTRFYPGYDGKLIRVFYHQGRIYYSDHHNLEVEDDEIVTYLDEISGSLFDTTKQFSPFVYLYLFNTPSYQQAGRISGNIIYLGYETIWNSENSPYPESEVDYHSFEDQPLSPIDFSDVVELLTPDQSIDPRLASTDFVIAFDEETGRRYKIESPAYSWRSLLLDFSQDLYYQFFLLSNRRFLESDLSGERQVYLTQFPLLKVYSLEEIKTFLPVTTWEEEKDENLRQQILATDDSRLFNIFLCFLLATPQHRQSEVVDFYSRYYEDRDRVTEWLIEVSQSYPLSSSLPLRARRIIQMVRAEARHQLNQGNIFSMYALINNYMIDTIYQEEGGSLYQLLVCYNYYRS